jgi:hypothetical protein
LDSGLCLNNQNHKRYRGLDKNAHHVFAACALINLMLARNKLLKLSQA